MLCNGSFLISMTEIFLLLSSLCSHRGDFIFNINHVKWWHVLTKCCVISTAIGVTSSLYSQIIFCMTLVRSSFSVSLTMCRSACITGRMKGTMYSLAKEQNTQNNLDTQRKYWPTHSFYFDFYDFTCSPFSWLLMRTCRAIAASTLTGISLSLIKQRRVSSRAVCRFWSLLNFTSQK